MEMDKNKLTKLSALEDLARRAKASTDAVAQRVAAVEEGMPTKVSELTNDSKFQTETEVAAAVAGADHLKRKIVASVDAIDKTAADAAQYIYMILKSSAKTGAKYDEYMVIDGEVENCVLFRGVRVKKGAKLKNCVIMQDCVIGEGTKLEYVVADKNVEFDMNRNMAGSSSYPVYVAKGSRV